MKAKLTLLQLQQFNHDYPLKPRVMHDSFHTLLRELGNDQYELSGT